MLNAGCVTLEELVPNLSNLEFSWHPLGFVVCKLTQEGSAAIRLHLWPLDGGRVQQPQWMIHDHLFDFTSWVLRGTICNREYDADPNGSDRRIYRAGYEGRKSVLTKTPKTIGLRKRREYEVHAGNCYRISSGVLHESILVGQETGVTVLLTEDNNENAPLVVGDLNGKRRYEYKREPVSKTALQQLLSKLH